ncbi:MAG: hypothetical protein MR496_05055 [Eubacterium sp.]|jgi:hypothetical protein|nr:hypothetical protein [Eubacterium sp.]
MGRFKPRFVLAGVELPLPDAYQQTISDLSSSQTGRTLDGKAHKDVVAVKDTVPLKWSKLEWEKAAEIANAVDGIEYAAMEYVDVRVPYKTCTRDIYVGDRKAEIVECSTDGKVYWSLEFSRIEV